jgi:3-phosphoshikimate 1-carboxyvinyltransferase
MIGAIGEGITCREIKATLVPDPQDPRKKKSVMPEDFRKEILLGGQANIDGGIVDIPGDISTAAFFMAAAAIAEKAITITQVGLNPTRSAILEHLKIIGCDVTVENKATVSGELRGDVTVTGGQLKARRLHGDSIVELIDELPIIALMAALADGTTVIRDAGELRHKESNRLTACIENLQRMGVKCGLLEDGMVVEGRKELSGADFKSFGDHRIAMMCGIASLFAVGPSTIDDESVVAVSCPNFFELLSTITS